MQLKICVSHLTWKVANKCLNVCERVEVEERNRNDPLPSPAVMCIVSVRGENPLKKKREFNRSMYSPTRCINIPVFL